MIGPKWDKNGTRMGHKWDKMGQEMDKTGGQFARTEMLLGRPAMEALAGAHVAVFGIGGVGGHICEALARSGVGSFDLIDADRVSLTNLNRQIVATHATLGKPKVQVMQERIMEITPQAQVRVWERFFLPENAEEFPFDTYDYVADAVDTVSAKLALAENCARAGVPLISAMGAGNKLDPTAFRVSDIYETKNDPLARVMRRELRKRGIERLKVVWSEETPIRPENGSVPGSTAFVPSVAGLIMAGEIVKDLTANVRREPSP